MHEDTYEAKALDQHFRYFGDSVTFTPVGGSGTSVDAQVMDLPDDARFVGRRFRVRVSQVANARLGAKVTHGSDTFRVVETTLAQGGSLDLDCEILQKRG